MNLPRQDQQLNPAQTVEHVLINGSSLKPLSLGMICCIRLDYWYGKFSWVLKKLISFLPILPPFFLPPFLSFSLSYFRSHVAVRSRVGSRGQHVWCHQASLHLELLGLLFRANQPPCLWTGRRENGFTTASLLLIRKAELPPISPPGVCYRNGSCGHWWLLG